ncbi:hypothetical protein SPURM210S_03779 [Streptomyces purpurascens]
MRGGRRRPRRPGKRATAAGQPGGSREPARSVTTVTRSGSISAGLSSTVSCGSCRVSRQVSSLTRCRPSPWAASRVSCSSSGGETVAVGSSATDSTGGDAGRRPRRGPGARSPAGRTDRGRRRSRAGSAPWKAGRPEQACVRSPPGRAGSRHQNVTAQGGGQREQQGGRTGAGGRAVGGAVQSAPVPVAAGGLPQRRAAADRLVAAAGRRRGEHRGQLRQNRQPVLGEWRPEPDGAVALRVRPPHPYLRSAWCRRVLVIRTVRLVPSATEYPGCCRPMGTRRVVTVTA